MTTSKARSTSVSRVREATVSDPPSLAHSGWLEAFPWLVQGTTTRGPEDALFDLGLFSNGSPEDRVRSSWSRLRVATGATRVVHARQVHGAVVRTYCGTGPAGAETGSTAPESDPVPLLADPCDGHVTDRPGVLLAVTTADCVPVFLVDPEHRAVAVLHAGWRGAAAGVLERGLEAMKEAYGTQPGASHVHFGPAICGSCYEVGVEVFEALGQPVPVRAQPIDLRAVLVDRALAAQIAPSHVSVSDHCTRCTGSRLFSHRAGDAQRHAGFAGIRR